MLSKLPRPADRGHGELRKLIYGMNLTLDGYVTGAGDELGWSEPSDELFQWWLEEERAIGLLLYGRRLWEAMSSHWPTRDQQPDATPAQIEFARNWRDTPKVVFSSTLEKVDWNTRLVSGDAVAEITRLRAEDGEPMRVGGALSIHVGRRQRVRVRCRMGEGVLRRGGSPARCRGISGTAHRKPGDAGRLVRVEGERQPLHGASPRLCADVLFG